MKRLTLLTAFALCILPVISGCGIGKTGVLFVTKTNMGFEVSTQPPTAELTISRVEGVVGPQFENAKKPPVMASFKFENTGIFAPHVGSAFATGDAAVTMAGLYGDKTYGQDWQTRANELKPDKASTTPTNSVLELDEQPEPGRWLPLPDWAWLNWLNPKLEFQKNDVRPVFFGTDTAFGVKVAWSGMTGQYPDTAKIGYNRKELALVPVSMKGPDQHQTKPFKMKIPSLLATLDSSVKAGGAANLDTTYIQYFATGNAATLLAMQKDVRMAMLARLDPNKEIYKGLFGEKLDEKTKTVAFVLLNPIYAALRTLEKDKNDSVAKMLADRMDSLEPQGLKYDFKFYTYNLANKDLRDDFILVPLSGRPFEKVHTYYTNLGLSIRQLEDSVTLTDQDLANFNGASIADKSAKRKELMKILNDLKQKRQDFEVMIYRNSTVLTDAVDHLYH